jgi:hypothetical protein
MLKRIITKLLLLGIVLSHLACEKEDALQTVVIEGRLIDQFTNEGIANASINGTSFQKEGSGLFSYNRDIDQNIVLTDEEGKFSLPLNFDSQENLFVLARIRDTISTYFRKSYRYESALDTNGITIIVKKYTPLQVRIKNINPFDEDDRFSFDVDSPAETLGAAYFTRTIDGIPFWEATENNGKHLYWVGDTVEATIIGYVLANTSMRIRWSVRRNGVWTTYQSDLMNPLEEGLNEFEIFY